MPDPVAPAAATPATPTAAEAPAPAPAKPAKASTKANGKAKSVAITQAPSVSASATETSSRKTADERAADLKASLDAAPSPEAAPDVPVAPPPRRDTPEAASGDVPAADDPVVKARAERMSRIEAVRAKERAADTERQARQKFRQNEGEVDKLRARLAELEPNERVFDSEEALLEAAERKGMSATKLAEWMRARLTDPAHVARQQALTSEQKAFAKIAELEKRLDAERQARETEQQSTHEQRAAVERGHTYLTQIDERAASHPLTAGLKAKYGGDGVVHFANRWVVPLLSEGYSLDELHDHMEQILDEVQIAPGAAAAPANGRDPSSKNGADQPIRTLSNRETQERTQVTEEIPLHKLPLDERARLLKERLGKE